MYPNLYYAFSDLFGLEIPFFKLVNSFGLFVAMAFLTGGFFLKKEIIRKTEKGVFSPTTSEVTIGTGATLGGILGQSIIGFVFGWKFLFLAFNAGILFEGGALPQTFLFSLDGNILLGLLGATGFGAWHW